MFYLDPRAKFSGYTDEGLAVYKVSKKYSVAKRGEEILNLNNRMK